MLGFGGFMLCLFGGLQFVDVLHRFRSEDTALSETISIFVSVPEKDPKDFNAIVVGFYAPGVYVLW